MSDRKMITEFLGKLLYEEKLCGMGMYWAKEVVVDYGSSKAKTLHRFNNLVNIKKLNETEEGIWRD